MKIVLAEDDKNTADLIRQGLSENGHSIEVYNDGRDALSHCLYNHFDVLVLDRMMPGLDGLSVVKCLRSAGNMTPVIFLTGMASVENRVDGLTAGGDDYLLKPFHFSELLARIGALARRPAHSVENTKLNVHDLELDLLTRTATRSGVSIDLLSKEFSLLEVLMRNSGRIVTKTMLLERVWDFNFVPQTTVVETHISRLRTKIDKPFGVALIHTSRNSGYSIHEPR